MPGRIPQQLSGGSQVWCVDLGKGSLHCVCSTKPLYYPRDPPVKGRLMKGSLQWQEDRWKDPSCDRDTGERGPPLTGRPVKRALQGQGTGERVPPVTGRWWKGPRPGPHSHNQGKQSRFTQNPHYGRCSPQPVLHLLHKTTWVATSVFHCKCVLGNLTADRNSHHTLWLTKQCNIM